MKTITVRYTVVQTDWYLRELEVPDDFDPTPEGQSEKELAEAEIRQMLYDAEDPGFNADACYDRERGQVECVIGELEVVSA